MLVLSARHGKLSSVEWNHVLGVLRGGGVVVFPTDTAYGLGIDPRVRAAAKKIFAIKGRDDKKPLSVTVASAAMARQYGVFSPLATRLSKMHWPGALMLVVPLRKTVAARPLKTLRGGNTVGQRYPDHLIAAALARKLGYPVTSTSANRSGQPVCYTLKEFLVQMKNAAQLPDLFIDAGPLPRRPTSTVVDCTGNKPRVLRQGRIRIHVS